MIDAIEVAVREQLVAVVSGAQVWNQEAPAEADLPTVVFDVGLTANSEGSAAVYNATVRVAVYADSREGTRTLGAAVRTALEEWVYGAAAVRIGPLWVSGVEPAVETEYNEWRLTFEFTGLAIG